jgi:hypothetical protein
VFSVFLRTSFFFGTSLPSSPHTSSNNKHMFGHQHHPATVD